METPTPQSDCDCGSEGPKAPPGQPAGSGIIRVLLVEDDQDDYFLTRDLFADIPGKRFSLDWARIFEEGLDDICAGKHDAYLLDYRLGAKTGIDLIREAHRNGCSAPVILMTGQGQIRTDMEALNAGAADYLEKAGLTAALLERSIRYALANQSAAAELERKVQERTEELARANEALRQADRMKDQFLSTLGHELRNPLAPILNALELMRLAADKPDVIARQRDRLARQVNQLTRLVGDLLDLSRINTGKLHLSPESITLQLVLEMALEISRTNLDKAALEITLELPDQEIRLHGDRVRLVQVFTNLLNNAAKYTEPGGTVRLSAELGQASSPQPPTSDGGTELDHGEPPSPTNRDVVRVHVIDNGVGIPTEILPHIFDLFTQADRTTNRSQGGLGVGLSLVKQWVEMHGGKVSAKSEGEGQGAEFIVELPTGFPSA